VFTIDEMFAEAKTKEQNSSLPDFNESKISFSNTGPSTCKHLLNQRKYWWCSNSAAGYTVGLAEHGKSNLQHSSVVVRVIRDNFIRMKNETNSWQLTENLSFGQYSPIRVKAKHRLGYS